MQPLSIVIAYHSGYGHTARVAACVGEGVRLQPGAEVHVLNIDTLDAAGWERLDTADAIIFGAPTYMGGVSARFKEFADASSRRWSAQAWKDKVAAGFTNAGTMGGDNLNALYQLMIFAMQHSMVWVGNSAMPEGEVNRVGAFTGLMTQANNASPEITPPEGDLETARRFGARVAAVAAQLARGR